MALCSDGSLATWGDNSNGQLGDSSNTASSVPVAVTSSGALSGKTVVAISAGGAHNLVLCSDGSLAAWGDNTNGQLGYGSSAFSSNVPVAVSANGVLSGKTVVAISAGSGHSLVLCSDGTLAAWGANTYGVLGNGHTSNSIFPIDVTSSGALSGKTIVAISAGGYFSLALCSDGTLAAWGSNSSGEFGNGNNTSSLVPVSVTNSGAIAGKTLASISAGLYSTLAMCTDGTLAAWGNNGNGELGNANNIDSNVPVAIITNGVLNGLSVTSLKSSPLGSFGSTNLAIAAIPLATITTPTATGISASSATLGGNVTSDYGGTISARGVVFSPTAVNSTPQIGGTGVTNLATSGATGTFTMNAASLSPGVSYTFSAYAINSAGISYSATGNFTTLTQLTFSSATTVPITSAGYSIATGSSVNIVLGFTPTTGTNLTVINNTGLGWIQGRFSNLGQGQSINLTYGGGSYSFVANYYGGTGNDLVLQWAGNLLSAWGNNANGELGNGSTTNSNIPAAVTSSGVLAGKTVVATSVGGDHSLALCSDGTLAAWGSNASGQLGNGNNSDSNVPVNVTSSGVLVGKTVVAISAGSSQSYALCSDGTVSAWGYGGLGELGNGNSTDSNIPAVVTNTGVLAGKTVVAISAGSDHCLALCSDGSLATWGFNALGELGNGNNTSSNVPVTVANNGVLAGKSVAAISAGSDHSMALCTDGTLVAWGWNYRGQLGIGNTTDSNVPVPVTTGGVLSGKTVAAISAGGYHSLALCSDSTLVTWGYNNSGQLGNGSNSTSTVPIATTTFGELFGKTVVAISGGWYHSLAVCSDGTLAAWGINSLGELGNGNNSTSNIPVAVTTSGVLNGLVVNGLKSGSCAYHTLAIAGMPSVSVPAVITPTSVSYTHLTLPTKA